MSLSNEIKIIRQRTFLTQTEFANALGVSYTSVNRWESGIATPNLTAMKSLKKYCLENSIDYTPVEAAWLNKKVAGGDQ